MTISSCVPTVIYSTVTLTPTAGGPPAGGVPSQPSAGFTTPGAGNATATPAKPSATYPVTAGAGAVGGSAIAAIAGAAAAFFLL